MIALSVGGLLVQTGGLIDALVRIDRHSARRELRREGQTLVVYVESGRVVIEERAHLLTRLQDEAISAATAAGHRQCGG